MSAKSGCCGPESASLNRDRHLELALEIEPAPRSIWESIRRDLVEVPGGFFDMGARTSTFPGDLDSPRREVRVSPFLIAPPPSRTKTTLAL